MPRSSENIPHVVGLSRFRGTSHEQCGVLVRGGKFLVALKVKNVHPQPRDNFSISLMDYLRLKNRGLNIVGFIHTHLDHHPAEPSDDDFAGAMMNPTMLHCIYKPSTGELTWYANLSDEE